MSYSKCKDKEPIFNTKISGKKTKDVSQLLPSLVKCPETFTEYILPLRYLFKVFGINTAPFSRANTGCMFFNRIMSLKLFIPPEIAILFKGRR